MEELTPEDRENRENHEPDTGNDEGFAGPPQVPNGAEEQAPPPSGPMPEVVVSHHGTGGGQGRRWLKIVAWALMLILVAGLCWFAYRYAQKEPAAPATTQSKDIPLLKIGMNDADYGELYPDMSLNEHSYLVNSQMFEGLVRYENKSKIVPALATDWTNPDDKTWVFTIKDGVKFHDGHMMTTEDVKYSLDAMVANDSDLAQTFADTIDSVSTDSDSKVTITTKTPDPTLLNKLVWLYIIDSNLPKGDEPSQAGTGPFQIKPGTTPTATRVQMVAFNGYHGGKPLTYALDFGSAKDADALVKDFQAGKFNIVGPVSPSTSEDVDSSKFVSSEPNVEFIGLNSVKSGPLQKKEVREAVRYAVDSLAIGEAADTKATPLSQLIPQSIPGYNPAIKTYEQDIAKAKQLLKEAGYPDGVTLTLSTANTTKQTDAIVDGMKKAGITVKVDRHDDFDEYIDYFISGKAEMYVVDYVSDTLDGLDVYNSTVPPFYYDNPKLTKVLDQAATETGPAQRLKLLQDAAVIIDEDVAVIPLYDENDIWLTDKDYALHQDMPSAYISVYFSKVHARE